MTKYLRVIDREKCIGCYSCMYACSRTWYKALTPEKAALRVRNYNGVEGAFSVKVCLACIDPDCARACPTTALTAKKTGGVSFAPEKCNNCGECVKACVAGALQWNHESAQPIICRHCGICVRFCPNEVIAMVESDVPFGGHS